MPWAKGQSGNPSGRPKSPETSAADLTTRRLALLDMGYQPTAALGKKALVPGWNGPHTPEQVAAWTVEYPAYTNTGILTAYTPAADTDIEHPEAADAVDETMRDWFDGRGTLPVRFGRPPRRMFLFQTDRPFKKLRVDYIDPKVADLSDSRSKKGRYHIEFLGDGEQFIAHGIHPEAKVPYSYHADRNPWNVPRSDLPKVDEAEAWELLTHITDVLAERFGFQIDPGVSGPKANGHDPDASEFVAQGESVDVEAALAGIHYGNINDTWKSCMGSLLWQDEPIQEVIETLYAATDASPGCKSDPKRARWMHRLCALAVWFLEQNMTHVQQLPRELQEAWHQKVVVEGKRPLLVYDKRTGLQLRGLGERAEHSEPTPREPPAGEATREADAPPSGAAPPEPKKYRFPLLRFGEMRPGTEPNYLVDELIPVAGLVLVYGAPKSGKSFWALDLMLHVALGWEYRERAVQQGTIIYLAFEGAHGYRKRCEAFRRHHCLTDEDPPLYVVPGRADLIKDHAALIRDMRDQIAHDREAGRAGEVRAIVLDTLNKSLIGSESKDVDMANYIAAAEAIQKAFGCIVIIVHHHGIDESRPRGHTSLRGAVDAQIKIVRDEQNNIVAEVEDMRDGPEGAQLVSRLVVVDVGVDVAGKPLTSAAVEAVEPRTYQEDGHRLPKLTRNQQSMFSILENAPAGLSTDDWNEQARAAGLGIKRRTDLLDLRNALLDRHLVFQNANVWFVAEKFRRKTD